MQCAGQWIDSTWRGKGQFSACCHEQVHWIAIEHNCCVENWGGVCPRWSKMAGTADFGNLWRDLLQGGFGTKIHHHTHDKKRGEKNGCWPWNAPCAWAIPNLPQQPKRHHLWNLYLWLNWKAKMLGKPAQRHFEPVFVHEQKIQMHGKRRDFV